MPSITLLAGLIQNPLWDVLVVLFLLASGFLVGVMGGGKQRLTALLFAIYLSLAVSPGAIRFFGAYGILQSRYRNMEIYIFFVMFLFFFLNTRVFRAMPRTPYSWMGALGMSISSAGLFFSGALSIEALNDTIKFSPMILQMFAGRGMYLVWSIVPLVVLFATARKQHSRP